MSEWVFAVTDLKQWTYCPRVVYYRACLPDIRPVTTLMQAGIAGHRDETAREERRSLRAYGLSQGERVFDLQVQSAQLGLYGRLDLAIALPDRLTPGGEAIVVEYKDSERVNMPHFKVQLAAYALLVEELWGRPVRQGFFYALPLRRATPVAITPALRRKVVETVTAMRTLVANERMPPPPTSRRPCISCEFRRFCNDVV